MRMQPHQLSPDPVVTSIKDNNRGILPTKVEVDKQEVMAITREDLLGTTPEPTFAGVTSFMRRKYTRNLKGVDVAVTGIPLDTATTNRPGARFGPRSIRAASTIMAWERPYGMAYDPFDRLAVVDLPVNNHRVEVFS